MPEDDEPPQPVLLSCTACPARHSVACDDCVVNVLWRDRPGRPAEVRAAEVWGVDRVW